MTIYKKKFSGGTCFLLPLLVLAFLGAPGCDDNRSPAEKPQKNEPAQAAKTRSEPDYDSVMDKLIALQNNIYLKPTDTTLVAPLIRNAFDTVCGCFMTVGKGVINPQFPAAAQVASQKTAAQHDGRRWALYLKSWFIGNRIPFSTTLKGEIMYSKILREKVVEDTLYQLIQTPLGSVIAH